MFQSREFALKWTSMPKSNGSRIFVVREFLFFPHEKMLEYVKKILQDMNTPNLND
jgi:hypothetical protein